MGIKVNVKKFSRSKAIEQPIEEQPEQKPETNNEVIPDEEDFNYNDSNFLDDLNKTNYNESIENEKQQEENIKLTKANLKEQEKLRKEQEKEHLRIFKEQEKLNKVTQIKKNKKIIDNDTNSLFSETGNQINGREKNILLKKVRQYKNLFPTELSKFKIKVNASEKELQNYLDEMEILVELDSVDDFLTDSILSSIKVIEGVSATTTNYNISGLSDLLKSNKEFHKLMKMLFIKYGCYSSIPPEYQLMFIVSTSVYICRNKNIKKNELNSFFE